VDRTDEAAGTAKPLAVLVNWLSVPLEPVVWQPAGNGTRISRLLGCIDHSERVSVLAGEKIADDGLAIGRHRLPGPERPREVWHRL
jgi:hypothetical protein